VGNSCALIHLRSALSLTEVRSAASATGSHVSALTAPGADTVLPPGETVSSVALPVAAGASTVGTPFAFAAGIACTIGDPPLPGPLCPED
jgi:hypothetical protein